MSDSEQPEQQPGFPTAGVSLGGLGAGDYDRSLQGEGAQDDRTPQGEGTHDEQGLDLEDEGAESDGPPAQRVTPEGERLTMPRGGLVAFRKSGGLRFTSRGFVAFRSGWVVPLEGTDGRPRRMTAEARDALAALVEHSRLSRKPTKTAATRDGYYYEVTARYGGHTRYAELADGAIPDEQRRLIEVLQRLMPVG